MQKRKIFGASPLASEAGLQARKQGLSACWFAFKKQAPKIFFKYDKLVFFSIFFYNKKKF